MSDVTLLPHWKEAIKSLLEFDHQPGTIISRKWLNEKFNISDPKTVDEYKKNELDFLNQFIQFRETLLEDYKIDLKNVIGHGYEIVHPRDQTSRAITTRVKNIGKEMKKMMQTIAFVDTSKLTESERQEHTDGLVKAAQISSLLDRRRLLKRL